MKTQSIILISLTLLIAISSNAQIAINTDGSTPDASTVLDMKSTDRGASFPNLDISDMSTAAPVTSPKTGLIAYNTNTSTGPGLVMWTGTQWVIFELEGTNWSLLGNAETDPAINFLGTTGPESLVIKTNDDERMEVTGDGRVSVNYASPPAGFQFITRSSGNNTAIAAVADGTYEALYAQNSGNGNAISAWAGGTSSSILGNYEGTGARSGVYGLTNCAIAYGIKANNDNASGTGLVATGNDEDIRMITTGTGGAFTGYHGILGSGTNLSHGIGVIGIGNDSMVFHYVAGGNGGAFTGEKAGVYGYATNTTDGTGVVGVGNRNVNYSILTGIGSGGAFSSDVCGVYGYATNTSGDRYGGYFADNTTYTVVAGVYGGTAYGIRSNGTLSTTAKGLNDEPVFMFCPEAPEVLYQDYGIGQLTNGKTHITLDPVLVKNIYVDENHPMKVFVTLEGDCNGIYITNKSAEGFDVVELQGGTSNITFSWQIVATRANEEFIQKNGSVEVSDYSKRFPPAPGPLESKMQKAASGKLKNMEQKNVAIEDAETADRPIREADERKK